MPKYGLISDTDAKTIEQTLLLILKQFPDANPIEFCEIGVYAGETGNGIREFIEQHNRKAFLTGIDNNKDKEPLRFKYGELIIGNSNEVYHKVEDCSQHLIFVDGCHCFAHVVADFFCYADKVRKGGFIAFHDAGKHILPYKDFQHGNEDNIDAYISVRKALTEIGLLASYPKMMGYLGWWELTFDEADPSNPAGGICVFKKLY